ncbi:MAG: bactofilin family protein [Burkholderiaceae bacterium]
MELLNRLRGKPLPTVQGASPLSAPARRHTDTSSLSVRGFSRTAGTFTLGTDVIIKAADKITCKAATIEGELHATMETGVLTIGRSGVLRGVVHANSAEIRGEFDGELIVRGKLVIFSTARVTGKIRFAEVVLWKGGHVSGNVKRLARPDAAKSPSRKHRPELVSPSVLMGETENPVTTSTY